MPIIDIRLGPLASPTAAMAVPKTTVHPYHRFVLRKNNIRLSRQSTAMDSEAKSHAVQRRPDGKLRLRVL
jgi:hypothetical protein